jgi:two-component system NtrC family sensor kinase
VTLNITQKLILIIVILVIMPILATGILANHAAKEIVTQLLNESQITLAREIAEQVSQLFRTAQADTKMLSALPALSDYYYNHFYSLQSEAEINRKQIEEFFLDMAAKSNFYYRICYLDADGVQVANITQGRIQGSKGLSSIIPFPAGGAFDSRNKMQVSSVMTIDDGQQRVVRFVRPLFDVWNNRSGQVLLELDFDKITDHILSRHVGKKGYAMLIDTDGRIQVHPDRLIRQKRSDELGVSSVAYLVPKMLAKRQGMVSYNYKGNRVAAFTTVEQNGWIVAVSLPESEFAERVNLVRARVLWVVMLAGIITLAVGIIFSWHFVQPIKQLAQATNVISSGQLPPQIEVVSNDELGLLTRSFNHMVRNLRRIQGELVKSEKLVSLGRLATGVAHEIRNPLNSMKVAAEILNTKQPTQEEVNELVDLISGEIAHLDDFVTDFLTYARQPPLNYTGIDVNQLVTDTVDAVTPRMAKKEIRVEMDLYPRLPVTRMDPFQMERALMNLVVNAIDAMPGGGRLKIATFHKHPDTRNSNPSFIQIVVCDTGVGLETDQIDRVFDPFYTTKDHGTGLGLSLTKSIVEAHGGSVTLEENADSGVTARIYLPERLSDKGKEIHEAD